ncbi:hypothetical protein ACQ143_10810 [Microbacterium sp. MC2]
MLNHVSVHSSLGFSGLAGRRAVRDRLEFRGARAVGHSILFVCTANVCRSPMMEFEFRRLVDASARSGVWRVASAGTHVGNAHDVCSEVSWAFRNEEKLVDTVEIRRPQPVTVEVLESHELVITASLAERAAIARILPSARSRTFTLREALALSRTPTWSGASLSELSSELDSHRGKGVLPVAKSNRFWFRGVHPLDIPDVHSSHALRHRRTLASTRQLVRALEQRLVAGLELGREG